jgi:hypothetical protein
VAPRAVRVGERVTVRAAIARAGAGTLVGPTAPATFGPVDVLASAPAEAGGDSVAWSLTVALFQLGDQDLSGIPFRWEGESEAVAARLRDAVVTVESALADTAAADSLRDIRAPAPVPLRWRWGRIALALGVLAAAIAAWILRQRRRRPPAPATPAVPAVPPDVEALRALRELEAEALDARGHMKEHYARLSLILRVYMERRFGLPAAESTTGEIQDLVRSRGRAFPPAAEVLALLAEADLVKFAKMEPGRDASGLALRTARAWVERTAPARARLDASGETPPAAAGGAG